MENNCTKRTKSQKRAPVAVRASKEKVEDEEKRDKKERGKEKEEKR